MCTFKSTNWIIIGCGQNYHKRCVVKVPNNCSYTLLEEKQRRRSTTLQVPRSPSGGSNSSLLSANSTQTEDSGLVRLANFFTGGNSHKDQIFCNITFHLVFFNDSVFALGISVKCVHIPFVLVFCHSISLLVGWVASILFIEFLT